MPPSKPQPDAESARSEGDAAVLLWGQRCRRALSLTLWLMGLAALASVLYDTDLVSALRGEEALVPEARLALDRTRTGLRVVATTAACLGVLLLVLRRPRSRGGLGGYVALLLTVYLVAMLELLAAPLAPPQTSIFAPHPSRGWALVPRASDDWMGVPVTINEQGLRGPVRAIPKPAGVQRVLFLGDSVTFGFQLEDDADTLPAQAEVLLRQQLALKVEAINGGVGGYSPWQEARLLVEDGLAYEPDVVVVNFVLNDVSEKLGLARFGGMGQGFQLEHSRAAHGIAWRSNVVRYLMRKRALSDGANERFDRSDEVSALSVGDLLTRPDDSAVTEAWNRTLPELARLIAHCRQRKIPVLLVGLPYTIQLEHPELDAPQRRLTAFAAEQGVEFLDLAPVFRAELERAEGDLDALFLDALHLTPQGCAVAADAIATRLADGLYFAD
jgi:lysophospholipase L1-like esterase